MLQAKQAIPLSVTHPIRSRKQKIKEKKIWVTKPMKIGAMTLKAALLVTLAAVLMYLTQVTGDLALDTLTMAKI